MMKFPRYGKIKKMATKPPTSYLYAFNVLMFHFIFAGHPSLIYRIKTACSIPKCSPLLLLKSPNVHHRIGAQITFPSIPRKKPSVWFPDNSSTGVARSMPYTCIVSRGFTIAFLWTKHGERYGSVS